MDPDVTICGKCGVETFDPALMEWTSETIWGPLCPECQADVAEEA